MHPISRLFVDEVGHASMKAAEHPNERLPPHGSDYAAASGGHFGGASCERLPVGGCSDEASQDSRRVWDVSSVGRHSAVEALKLHGNDRSKRLVPVRDLSENNYSRACAGGYSSCVPVLYCTVMSILLAKHPVAPVIESGGSP
jgi:hypothetical protein